MCTGRNGDSERSRENKRKNQATHGFLTTRWKRKVTKTTIETTRFLHKNYLKKTILLCVNTKSVGNKFPKFNSLFNIQQRNNQVSTQKQSKKHKQVWELNFQKFNRVGSERFQSSDDS